MQPVAMCGGRKAGVIAMRRYSAQAMAAAAACLVLLSGVSTAVAGGRAAAGAGAAVSATWRTAKEVPGIAALNKGGVAEVSSVSCASAANCSAVGSYTDSAKHQQAFAATETNGTWHKAIEVPGTAALNQGGNAQLASVSCASAGNCSAGGFYADSSGHQQAFVVSQVNGTWHKAIEVPGTAALNQGELAAITSVSCASAGNCSAGGIYFATGGEQVFVGSQVNGAWHKAIEVPGTAALNQGGFARFASVSCASAGDCSAGGDYQDSSGNQQAFVLSQVNGTWHTIIEVPGLAALNQGASARITSVSCASAGNCSAGGQYVDNFDRGHVFVVSQVNGTWHKAIEVPGTAALNQGGGARMDSVSCASAGNCSAGGQYTDSSSNIPNQAFVVSQVNGTWHKAIEVPGTAALNQGELAAITSVSCASAGNCSAGGFYADSPGHQQAFVVSQVDGTWHKAIEAPGTAALNQGGNAAINTVSCASAGNCSAGGSYTDSSGHQQAFVVRET
jgi:hypothetical protein